MPTDLRGRAKGTPVVITFPAAGSDPGATVNATVGTNEVTFSLRTRDPAVAKARNRIADAHLEATFNALRAGAPTTLTFMDAVALSGDIYRDVVAAMREDPHLAEGVLYPPQGMSFTSDLEIPSAEAQERRVGKIANHLGARHGLLNLDAASRAKLVAEVDRVMAEAGRTLRRHAEGDYSPDLIAQRFPVWKRQVPKVAGGGVTWEQFIGLWEGVHELRGGPITTRREVRAFTLRFEDLSRYRMRTDRPRRENSQLMLWSHRGLREEVDMQADLYGVYTADTGAAFTSRYHAATGTPGIRVKTLDKRDVEDPVFMERITEAAPGLDPAALRPGNVVPMAGGDQFCCIRGSDGFTLINADINAAQNLQRRFWTRHGDAYRLVATRIVRDGELLWVPIRLGERVKGALGGPGYLAATGHDTGSCRWQSCKPSEWRRLSGAMQVVAEDEDSEVAGLEEEILERSGQIVTFFRDPSGVVLPAQFWYPSKTFWGIVNSRTWAALRRRS